MEKQQHGGLRKGAGRPPTGRKSRQIWLSDEEYQKIKDYVKKIRGISNEV